MKRYQHLFFDLDHTLWDYDRNVTESLNELYDHYDLKGRGISSFQIFFDSFHHINFQLWDWYNVGKIDKENLRKKRFEMIFEHAGASKNNIPVPFEADFMHRTSSKPHVFPYTFEILNYLKERYELHIITNGFDESQAKKIRSAKLEPYFDLIVTSETTGHKKPDARIFHHTVERLGTSHDLCLMIGDNPKSDILGAINAGIDQVFFNPKSEKIDLKPTYTIGHLQELEKLL
ncbi:YjjG family noncanonical pyrimidine nucleotidase [Algoriphagus sediminis]|uniref:YjjG family noncanonical pyrimidine nucleotidase n=1 Tax=Algoriphagus sediminis TaxID=3057113 RepID=A0ABT7YH25_9BACT|nr:YjjG family noncanonical pyrimidine nucleotidase [Algoriphagus sediminis]MDN3205837.1 YjjG family noncanonical pyrimidine nucleotidase [Algoriphagus sediminis]